jgi:hypothetical protein
MRESFVLGVAHLNASQTQSAETDSESFYVQLKKWDYTKTNIHAVASMVLVLFQFHLSITL